MSITKSFDIPRQSVRDAWELVKANKGSAGVDGQTIEDFEKNLDRNLYKVWNRMSSGTYFPLPVKGVEIPKKGKGTRLLGVPSTSDRLAQSIAKLHFEPIVEQIFHKDSFGYRPGKSAHDAIAVTKRRCWRFNYVLEFDIVGLFDEISHDLMMKAVRFHTDSKWLLLYIERWLKASFKMPDGTLVERHKGTPQGGVISPILSNLFLHYTFDSWMQRSFPQLSWVRYADDGLVHCRTHAEAMLLYKALEVRLKECGLKLHSEKTKIVYCGTGKPPKTLGVETQFTFLGFCFRKRGARNPKTGNMFIGFLPAISKESLKSIRDKIRSWKLASLTHLSLKDLANQVNPVVRGWIQYYGAFYRTEIYPLAHYLNQRLAKWISKKFKKRKNHRVKSYELLGKMCNNNPRLFVHWQIVAVC